MTDDNLTNAAQWLERRTRDMVRETERKFGVYIAIRGGARVNVDYVRVDLHANVWPEVMRIVEDEPVSKAIG